MCPPKMKVNNVELHVFANVLVFFFFELMGFEVYPYFWFLNTFFSRRYKIGLLSPFAMIDTYIIVAEAESV